MPPSKEGGIFCGDSITVGFVRSKNTVTRDLEGLSYSLGSAVALPRRNQPLSTRSQGPANNSLAYYRFKSPMLKKVYGNNF